MSHIPEKCFSCAFMTADQVRTAYGKWGLNCYVPNTCKGRRFRIRKKNEGRSKLRPTPIGPLGSQVDIEIVICPWGHAGRHYAYESDAELTVEGVSCPVGGMAIFAIGLEVWRGGVLVDGYPLVCVLRTGLPQLRDWAVRAVKNVVDAYDCENTMQVRFRRQPPPAGLMLPVVGTRSPGAPVIESEEASGQP